MQVNIFDAKTDLSKLIKKLESKEETSITIARHGKPIAVLIPFEEAKCENRIGIAKGQDLCSGDFDADNDLISEMFYGEV